MKRPLAIDLFTGLHGWSTGLIAEGWSVIGFDIEDMCAQFGEPRPEHVQLVLQDVLTIHGKQFRDASLIVASPPCQFFSYTAMPWSRAKALAAEVRADPARLEKELALFNACFRIQSEACVASGRHIPLVVENVRGAVPWVGRERGRYGSFLLWGDVPALMPMARMVRKQGGNFDQNGAGVWNRGEHIGEGHKVPGFRFDGSGKSFQSESVKVASLDGERRTDVGKGARFTSRDCGAEKYAVSEDGVKGFTPNGGPLVKNVLGRKHGSKSKARKVASASIAKIPLSLARHIARCWLPKEFAEVTA